MPSFSFLGVKVSQCIPDRQTLLLINKIFMKIGGQQYHDIQAIPWRSLKSRGWTWNAVEPSVMIASTFSSIF